MRLAVFLAVLSVGCVPPQVGETQSAIVGGTADTGDPAVVLIIIGDPNGGYIYMCTGEVISPHVILTAAHCTNDRGPYNIYLGTDINRVRPSDLYPGTAHKHPSYRNSVIDDFDIGIVVLDEAVPSTITPLPFLERDPADLVGQTARLVGYGSTGSLDPNDTSAGTKRMTNSKLSRVRSRLLEFSDTAHNTCEGDSGGPALMMVDGVETIVGVTSFGEHSFDYCNGHGFNTRVDLYTDFIQPFIDMHDPPPPPMNGEQPAPGQVGAGCTSHDECNSKICANAPNGYCTAACDPNAAVSVCPGGLHCAAIGGDPQTGYVCERDQRAGGCSVSTRPAPPWLLLLLLLAFVRRRVNQ
jgi:MYXO-CTERM domain-containing protein